jgi:hypothetical protein
VCRAFSYALLNGNWKEFILLRLLGIVQQNWHDDHAHLRALWRFGEEEMKHQLLLVLLPDREVIPVVQWLQAQPGVVVLYGIAQRRVMLKRQMFGPAWLDLLARRFILAA